MEYTTVRHQAHCPHLQKSWRLLAQEVGRVWAVSLGEVVGWKFAKSAPHLEIVPMSYFGFAMKSHCI